MTQSDQSQVQTYFTYFVDDGLVAPTDQFVLVEQLIDGLRVHVSSVELTLDQAQRLCDVYFDALVDVPEPYVQQFLLVNGELEFEIF